MLFWDLLGQTSTTNIQKPVPEGKKKIKRVLSVLLSTLNEKKNK